ncbi:GxxExxY protein [Dyadobacter sp. 32]|uniref:GxxExxY protein n=1 Tax=Dyadobacter sp. 32 TaxID=538966 RepID=UPI0011F05C11
MQLTRKYLEELEYKVIGAAIEVHRRLGAGLLESVYHQCFARELQFKDIEFVSEHVVQISYRDLEIDTLLRADFLIANCLVVELKAIESVLPIHDAQLITYMKLLKAPKGLLINFNCKNIIHDGKKSFVNEFYRELY